MMLEMQLSTIIAIESRDFVAVHAGVVADGDRAIVMPGVSFSGKTTLVRALVEAGAVYYSDEYAMFDEAGRVHPYARQLSFRPPEGLRSTSRRAVGWRRRHRAAAGRDGDRDALPLPRPSGSHGLTEGAGILRCSSTPFRPRIGPSRRCAC